MDDIIKEQYINILNKMGKNDLALDGIKEFIDTYDGTNIDEFERMFLSLVKIYTQKQRSDIKANAYDEIKKTTDEEKEKDTEFDKEENELKAKKSPASHNARMIPATNLDKN